MSLPHRIAHRSARPRDRADGLWATALMTCLTSGMLRSSALPALPARTHRASRLRQRLPAAHFRLEVASILQGLCTETA